MSEVEIISLLPGTRLERDLYSVDGHLLLGRDTVLNEKHLDRLLQLGYTHLYTSDMQESVKPDIERQIHSAPNSRLPQVFGQAVDNVRHLMSKVASGHMVPREDIEETIDLLFPQVIQTGNVFARLQELRQQDEYTMQHSVSVGVIAIKIGQTLGLSQNILRNLGIAGLMHDIGKARIAQDILNKPGPLDAGEFREMQKHPVYGYQIVRDLSLDDPNIGAAVLQHHEHQNGTGYPQQLKANQINSYSNIIAVADVFDALTSDRVYHRRMPLLAALSEITEKSCGHFDPVIAGELFKYFINLTPGAKVTLNNGETATVLLINQKEPSRPLIRTSNRFIDLEQERNISIVELQF